MELIHLTPYCNREKIISEGLIPGNRREKAQPLTDTEIATITNIKDLSQIDIDIRLMKYKPQDIPDWLDLNQCLYFTEINDYKRCWEKHYGKPYGWFKSGFKLNTDNLDTSKLFVMDNNSELLFHYLNAIKDNDIIEMEKLTEKWWNQMIDYQIYDRYKHRLLNPNTWPFCYEFLYFGKVPKEILTEVNSKNY